MPRQTKDLFSKEELFPKIAERFEQLCAGFCVDYDDRETTLSDLERADQSIPDIDWNYMLRKAGDGDFLHDILGIKEHIDRKTQTMQPGFQPRCCA
jgi:hypothetical protein